MTDPVATARIAHPITEPGDGKPQGDDASAGGTGNAETPAARRPWYASTLAIECPDCGAAAGEHCKRDRFHVNRYEDARELAGYPVRHRRDRAPNQS